MSAESKLAGTFTVEFGDAHGRQQTVSTLRKVFRGYWSLTNFHRRKGADGQPLGGRPVGDAMSQMVDSPGMRLQVNLETGRVREYDPLENDPETLERICRVLGRARGGVEVKYRPQPSKSYELDEHTLKTLVKELRYMVTCDEPKAKLVEGKLPSEAEIAAMPGRILFDPGNSDPHKFRFQDEFEKWLGKRRTAGAA